MRTVWVTKVVICVGSYFFEALVAFSAFVDAQTSIGRKEAATLVDVFDSAY